MSQIKNVLKKINEDGSTTEILSDVTQGGGGDVPYTAGDGINIVDHEVSVKHDSSLSIDDNGQVGVTNKLPSVTSVDEGKVLTVNSEGAWDAETPSSGGGDNIIYASTFTPLEELGSNLIRSFTIGLDDYETVEEAFNAITTENIKNTKLIITDNESESATLVLNLEIYKENLFAMFTFSIPTYSDNKHYLSKHEVFIGSSSFNSEFEESNESQSTVYNVAIETM